MYRVAGPFSVPDFGRGSYSALLCLRLLAAFESSGTQMTIATAMNLSFDGIQCEVDFIAWRGRDRLGSDHRRAPQSSLAKRSRWGMAS